jgi:hypothetical protein
VSFTESTSHSATDQPMTGRYDDVRGTGTTRLETHTTETRRSVVTSELWAFLVACAAILVAAYTDEAFDVDHAWTLVAGITAAYLLSRGIAKAGSKERYERERDRY